MLVLSLFPGIGLLDRAFEEEGFCVVRGPDLLWGGDIRQFHVPPGRFDGIVGGTPCQAFSRLLPIILKNGYTPAPNLIPEFERVISEAQPSWFLMENVRGAPLPVVDGYQVDAQLYNNRWIGGEQSREHRLSFGTRDGRRLRYELAALEHVDWSPRVCAAGGHSKLVKLRAGGIPKKRIRNDGRIEQQKRADRSYLEEAKRLQGLPPEWDLPGFTVAAKVKALGNAVPLPMGRAIARAVKAAVQECA